MRSVTIIICTRNRAGSLGETLASVGACCVPADVDGEVLVVDNGSTDDTPAAVATAALTNLSVRCVREPRPGKGYAYNAGMAAARGNAFLFTDDDVRVPRDWIEGMCRPLLDGTADAVAGGVRFAGHLRREWMTAQQRAWLASTDQLPDEPNWRMVGANMAFAAMS